VFGMRGHVFRTVDGGDHWRAVDTGTTIGFNSGRVLADGRVVLVGNSGLMAISSDDGASFQVRKLAKASGLAQAAADGTGALVLVGDAGIQRLADGTGEGRP
jgi:photosystem II stability/assembly factor-like uncharacterized protein